MDRLPRDVLVEHILTPCLYEAWHDLLQCLCGHAWAVHAEHGFRHAEWLIESHDPDYTMSPRHANAFRHIVFRWSAQEHGTEMHPETWTAMRTMLKYRAPLFPFGRTLALMRVCKQWHAALTTSVYEPLRWHWTLCTLLCVYKWGGCARCPGLWFDLPYEAHWWKEQNGYRRWRKHLEKRRARKQETLRDRMFELYEDIQTLELNMQQAQHQLMETTRRYSQMSSR